MKQVVRDSVESEVFPASTGGLIDSVLDFHELRVRDVMVPRGQMDVVEEGASLSDVLSIGIETGHSRYPVIRANRDEVIGILLVKELLGFFASREEGGDDKPFDVRALIRSPMFVPESKRLDALLAEFRLTRTHMAIVLDEFGGVAGLVTIEDVLEEIVGDIDDEFDVEERVNIRRQAPRRHTVRALTPIAEFNEAFGTDFSDDEYDTIGGLVSNTLGHLPRRGEVARLGEYEFKVLGADRRRLHLLLVTKLDFPSAQEGGDVEDKGK
jgi:magnesium and cobalt transporter